jgi:hypothetical protein
MRFHAAPRQIDVEEAREHAVPEPDGRERRAGTSAHYAPPEAAMRHDRDASTETRRQFAIWG